MKIFAEHEQQYSIDVKKATALALKLLKCEDPVIVDVFGNEN
jgi:hypothetical protein